MCKGTSRHQAQPKAPPPARNEGGPPVPPGRQRTTGTTPQAAPSRPREEAYSLAPHEVSPSTQARRGPGAAMVLSRIGCHRAPFGSFPREGKNSTAHRPMCKGTALPPKIKNAPARATGKSSFAIRRSPESTTSRAADKGNPALQGAARPIIQRIAGKSPHTRPGRETFPRAQNAKFPSAGQQRILRLFLDGLAAKSYNSFMCVW